MHARVHDSRAVPLGAMQTLMDASRLPRACLPCPRSTLLHASAAVAAAGSMQGSLAAARHHTNAPRVAVLCGSGGHGFQAQYPARRTLIMACWTMGTHSALI